MDKESDLDKGSRHHNEQRRGTYMLSHVFDPLLKNTPGRKVIKFPAPEVGQ